MTTLSIDIETYSSNDLKSCGVYKYVEAADFTVLMIAYSFDGGEVATIDLEDVTDVLGTDWFLHYLQDPNILKTAHNANFERVCLSKFFGVDLPVEQWECTMVKSAMLGLPLGLDAVAKVLKLSEQKDNAGKALIRYFSVPCKPRKSKKSALSVDSNELWSEFMESALKDGAFPEDPDERQQAFRDYVDANYGPFKKRNMPSDAPEKWTSFLEYCRQDVRTEMAIRDKISFFEIPQDEKELWYLDQKINDRGIAIDVPFVENAIEISRQHTAALIAEAVEHTGLDNPNSGPQLKAWLSKALDTEVTSLTKEAVPSLLKGCTDETVSRVLAIRQELAKTSVKKFDAMLKSVCADGRVRGLLQFCGANRTGRWAGRLIQVQNLAKNFLSDLDLARQVVCAGDRDTLAMAFGNVPDTLSQLIRTAFVASEGRILIPTDFSAIEARVIAWLAGEQWRLDVFNTHGKIYEASASQMFNVPLDLIKKGNPEYALRAKGKVAELALGYQGGAGALIQMGALKGGLTEAELPAIVSLWRKASPAIVKMWSRMESAAIETVLTGVSTRVRGLVTFRKDKGVLFAGLPSGRELAYVNPKLVQGKFGGDALTYEGMDQTTKQWKRIDTYGGKLVENIVQAIARDCLAVALTRLDKAGYDIAMSVHDEGVLDVPLQQLSIEENIKEINRIMAMPIPWAQGLPLTAESYATPYYRKED